MVKFPLVAPEVHEKALTLLEYDAACVKIKIKIKINKTPVSHVLVGFTL